MSHDPGDLPRLERPAPLKLVGDVAHDVDATWLDRLLEVLLLNVYGFKGSMSRRVRADVAFAAMLIIIQACVDFLAWFLGMKLVFVGGFGPWIGFPLALLFAALFASTIAIFERSVLVADVSMKGLLRNAAIWFRMLFVLGASVVTAVPLELFLFADDLEGVLNQDRAVLVARARDALRANVDALVANLDAALDKDLARAEQQFAPLRAYEPPNVSSVTPRIQALEAQLERVTQAMQQEDEGRRSGASGRGRRYKSLEGQLETLGKQLAQLQRIHAAELADLRTEARTRADAGEAAHRDAVAALRAAHGKERAALLQQRADIDLMETRVLAARSRMTVDVPEGFSARVRILHALAAKDSTVDLGIWALRMVMVLFGVLVLVQKATFATETRAYFSALAQAAQGDARLRRMFGSISTLPEMSDRERATMHAASKDDPRH